MDDRSPFKKLDDLATFYARARATPESVTDTEFVETITNTFWGTTCWDFVEEAFAIIAPGCAMRPHLVRQLIVHPIEAMIAGGLEDENDVIAQGIAFALKTTPYLAPTPEGRRWLLEEWPKLGPIAIDVFRETWRKLSA